MLPAKITREEWNRLKGLGYRFRPATLYSPQHTSDRVVVVTSPAGNHPYHYQAPVSPKREKPSFSGL